MLLVRVLRIGIPTKKVVSTPGLSDNGATPPVANLELPFNLAKQGT
jgi:hypothetical protein